MVCIAGILLTITGSFNLSCVVSSARVVLEPDTRVKIRMEGIINSPTQDYMMFSTRADNTFRYRIVWLGNDRTGMTSDGSDFITVNYAPRGTSVYDFAWWTDDYVEGPDTITPLLAYFGPETFPIDSNNCGYCFPEPTVSASPVPTKTKRPRRTCYPSSTTAIETRTPTETRSRRVRTTPTDEFTMSDAWSPTNVFTEEDEAKANTPVEVESDKLFVAITAMVAIILAIVLVILIANCYRKITEKRVRESLSDPPESD
jgi:hypothetical protein